MSYQKIKEFDIITCDKCGYQEKALSSEAGKRFFESGWSLNRNAKKYKNKCGRCNGKNAPVKTWERIKSMQKKNPHPLIKSITNAPLTSN